MAAGRCLLLRNTGQPEPPGMYFPFLLLLKLGTDLGEAHAGTYQRIS